MEASEFRLTKNKPYFLQKDLVDEFELHAQKFILLRELMLTEKILEPMRKFKNGRQIAPENTRLL